MCFIFFLGFLMATSKAFELEIDREKALRVVFTYFSFLGSDSAGSSSLTFSSELVVYLLSLEKEILSSIS